MPLAPPFEAPPTSAPMSEGVARPPGCRPLKAPCWWCSRRLRGGRGWLAAVDGNPVAFHRYCLADALYDVDFGRRVVAPEGFSSEVPIDSSSDEERR